MSAPVSLIMRQFLAWIADAPRTYAETMEAWRTSCPRLSVWEDATLDGLVCRVGGRGGQTFVRLTQQGRGALVGAALIPARNTSKINPDRVSQEP